MTGTPRSKEFDDVYFSEKDGLAETRHVFLEGNGLPGRWAGASEFTIFETGFGTGLNFLATWKLFRATKKPGAKLRFISVEKFPLSVEQIKKYLAPWEELQEELNVLCKKYPVQIPRLRTSCFARDDIIVDDDMKLTLIFGDVNEIMPQVEDKIDCWFLDGFKPSANPEMWSEVLFRNMARLSNKGATFATFTAAGVVKRGLRAVGFTVEKVDGFGWKRDMLRGVFE